MEGLIKPGGDAGSYLRFHRFSGFHGHPSKEICQSFENCSQPERTTKWGDTVNLPAHSPSQLIGWTNYPVFKL